MLLNECGETTRNDNYPAVVFPIIRRAFGKLFSDTIVDVQAMGPKNEKEK